MVTSKESHLTGGPSIKKQEHTTMKLYSLTGFKPARTEVAHEPAIFFTSLILSLFEDGRGFICRHAFRIRLK